MNRFTGRLQLESISPERLKALESTAQLYQLLQDFPYQSDVLAATIVVPAGFLTDFASIPRPVWNIIDPEDPAIGWASVVHDWLYTCEGQLPAGLTYTRQQADAVLREAMEACGASKFIRNAVYLAVRVGGGSHWKPTTEASS